MGFVEALLLTFIILKLVGVITWSWFLVLAPVYFDVLLYLCVLPFGMKMWRNHKREVKEFDDHWRDIESRFHL